MRLFSGETGIRTLGPASWSTVFETAPIDHSGTSPDTERYTAFSFAQTELQRYNIFSNKQLFSSKKTHTKRKINDERG